MKARITLFLIVSAAVVLSPPVAPAQEPAEVLSATAPATAPAETPAAAEAVEPSHDITVAATVEQALAYSAGELNILSSVRDGGSWNHLAFYVLLRRAAMLPEGLKTIDEAEQPNPRDFWKEPQRYRGRLVRFEGKIPAFKPTEERGQITIWTNQLTSTKWWGNRAVFMVHVQEETTGQPMLVAMLKEPHKGITTNQKLRFAGIFYKLATLSENLETGDPNVTHEYPVIVAKQFYAGKVEQDESWYVAVIVLVLAALVAAFVAVRQRNRRLIRRDALGQERRRREVPAEYEGAPVEEELRRQIEAGKPKEDKQTGGTNAPR